MGDEVELPVDGEETETEARAGIVASTMQHKRIFIINSSFLVSRNAHTYASAPKGARMLAQDLREEGAATLDVHQLTFNTVDVNT